MSHQLTLQIPVKVMLAGEYALLAPGGTGLALAVVPGFQVEVAMAAQWQISLPDLSLSLGAQHLPDLNDCTGALRYVVAALQVAATRLPLAHPLAITLTSMPRRVPVGASAALVAGTLVAAAQLAETPISTAALMEASLEAHGQAQGSGSGYDVATILLGGSVLLIAGDGSIPLRAHPAPLFPGLTVVAAQAGPAAATGPLVEAVLSRAASEPATQQALAAHCDSTGELVEALSAGPDWQTIAKACQGANATLEALDRAVGGAILTPSVRATMKAAGAFPVRVSGAGGGDLVIGFARDAREGQALAAQWHAAGFAAWPLELAPLR